MIAKRRSMRLERASVKIAGRGFGKTKRLGSDLTLQPAASRQTARREFPCLFQSKSVSGKPRQRDRVDLANANTHSRRSELRQEKGGQLRSRRDFLIGFTAVGQHSRREWFRAGVGGLHRRQNSFRHQRGASRSIWTTAG